jgi:hypothetical protein
LEPLGQEHWIGKVSDAQKTAVKVAPDVLAKYTGVYKGIYLRSPRTVDVTFSDGKLFVSVNGGPKQPIVPQSDTNFSGTGLTYAFIRGADGIATDVLEGHISGEYKFARQN